MTPLKSPFPAPTTILFDLGNVLFSFDYDRAITGFAEKLERPKKVIGQIFKDPDYAILFYEFGTGRMSPERFVKKLNEFFGSSLSLETMSRIWCSIFREDKRMTALLRKLSKDYRTFIVSDTDILHWSHLQETHNLEDMVTGAILSFRTGSMKADPGAFDRIVQRYRFSPALTCFIDDVEKNIRAAEGAGIRGILHRSYEETLKALGGLGVEIGNNC
jgi:putative hydrolase of the HAD superfamily